MKNVPNMRVEVTLSSVDTILGCGGCVSYLSTGKMDTVYAEGKPDHLDIMMQKAGVTVVGEVHKIPNFRNEPGAYLNGSE